PSKMWQSVSKASTCVGSALTAGSFGVTHGLGNLVVSARHEAADRHGTGVTDVGAAGGHHASRCGRRHLGCPRPRCRSWHRTIAGSRMRLYRGPTPHDGRPCASFSCSLTVEAGSTYSSLAFMRARACAAAHVRVPTSSVRANTFGWNSVVSLTSAMKMNVS